VLAQSIIQAQSLITFIFNCFRSDSTSAAKKRDSSKKKTRQKSIDSVDSRKEAAKTMKSQENPEADSSIQMKKFAKIKPHGIDNVSLSRFPLAKLISFNTGCDIRAPSQYDCIHKQA
jgi:hypothetical protein